MTNIVQAIDCIADLRAATACCIDNTQVSVAGYVTPGDGAGGIFYQIKTDTTSADNGGTIFVDASGRRWHRAGSGRSLDLLWFCGTTATDYHPAIAAAFAVASTLAATQPGVEIIMPPGNFSVDALLSFNYPTTPFKLSIRGAASDATVLTFASGGFCFNMTIPQHTIHMSDMTLAAGAAGSSTAITCNQTTPQGLFGQNEFENLTFRGSDYTTLNNYWASHIVLNGLGNVNFRGLLCYGHPNGNSSSEGTGIIVEGLATGDTPYGIVYNFTDCSFWELGNGITYGNNVQGMTVKGCNFTNTTNGILQPSGAEGGAQLAVSDSQFNCFGNGIVLFGALNNLQVTNNLFLVLPENANAIGLGGSGAEYTINGNVFATMGAPTSGTSAVAFVTSPATYQIGTVQGNTIDGFVTGVNLTGATKFNVSDNEYVNCTDNVFNPGGSVNSVGIATS